MICSQGRCSRDAQPGRKMCKVCAEKMRDRNRRYRSSDYVYDVNNDLHCDRCGDKLAEVITPTTSSSGEPPMNLHTYACENPHCHHDRVRLVMTLPRKVGLPETVLDGKLAQWDDPLGEIDEEAISKNRDIALEDRQKICPSCGEVFDTGYARGTATYARRSKCSVGCAGNRIGLGRGRLRDMQVVEVVSVPLPEVKVLQRSQIIGHENGVPVRRVDRGVGYSE